MSIPHGLYNECVLKTYQHTANWFAKAKSPLKGRPFRGWGKVYKVDDTFRIMVYDHQICTITPDNVLTMVIDGNEGAIISNTLSSSLHRLAPIAWHRAGMRRYRILPLRAMDAGDNYWQVVKEAPELFEGLQFDLTTGKALNAKPDILQRVDTEARREWLRALRKFKAHVHLRVRMGVFEAVQNELNNTPAKRGGRPFTGRPQWNDEKWMDLLHTSIRDSQYPKELLAGILLTMPSVIWSQHARTMTLQEKVKQTVDHIINSNSVELRTRFGVFSDEVTSEKAK